MKEFFPVSTWWTLVVIGLILLGAAVEHRHEHRGRTRRSREEDHPAHGSRWLLHH